MWHCKMHIDSQNEINSCLHLKQKFHNLEKISEAYRENVSKEVAELITSIIELKSSLIKQVRR